MKNEQIYMAHPPEREINPRTFVYERDILAEAQVSLKNAWKPIDGGRWRPMEAKFFINKSAVCLQNTFRPVAS